MAVAIGNVGEGKIHTSIETYNHDALICGGKAMSISNTSGVDNKMYANCASLCRKAINEIRSIMFLLEGKPDVLQNLQTDLESIKEYLYCSCSSEKGLPLLPKDNSRAARKSGRNLLSLPARKRKWQ